jgi:excisionase family DNA binding protein
MSDQQRKPLYVRLPAPTAKKLDRFAVELGMSKQDLVADLVDKQLPSAGSRRVVVETADDTLTVGRASFMPNEPSEVLTAAEASELLRSDEATVIAMAADRVLPGRKVGGEWRFTRSAILRWLAGEQEE